MAPKPLNQGEIVYEGSFGSTENPTNESGMEVGRTSLGPNQNLHPPHHGHQIGHEQRFHSNDYQPTAEIVHAPKRTTPSFTRKQQRDPMGHLMARESLSASNLACPKPDAPETRQMVVSSDAGFMIREGDFLDRTFDNVENVACHRTSNSKAPPEPLFSCNEQSRGNFLCGEDAYDIHALSSAKQQGYDIERSDEDSNHGQEVMSPGSGRPPLVPVNSILSEQRGVSVHSEQKRDMLDILFENVQSMICREDRSLAIGPEDSKQIDQRDQPKMRAQSQELEQQPMMDFESSNNEPSPINLHKTVPDFKSDGFTSGCDSVFQSLAEDSVRRSPIHREAFAPIRYEHETPSQTGSRPRTGMMLLADGSVVVPGECSNQWVHREKRRTTPMSNSRLSTTSPNRQPMQSGPTIRASRGSSLLDIVSRSGDGWEDGTERLGPIRQQKGTNITRGEGTVAISPEVEGGLGFHASSMAGGAVSADDIERQNFRKQVIFAATILLLACGLIVFAMSFFWPTHKMTR